jgi:hypothetical protein
VRYSLVKVLLTVSLLRLSLLHPLALYPANHRSFTPLFSTSSEPLFSQLLCFHIYLRCPIVFFQHQNNSTSVLSVRCFFSKLFCPQQLAASLSSLSAFFALASFVFNRLQPLFPNARGMGIPGDSAGRPVGGSVNTPIRPSSPPKSQQGTGRSFLAVHGTQVTKHGSCPLAVYGTQVTDTGHAPKQFTGHRSRATGHDSPFGL